MLEIADKIKSIRAIEHLSQEEFSRLIGYSKGYLADIETGRTKPSRKFLESIQEKYGVSIDWILRESQILDLINANKTTEHPHLIFTYAFTQNGIEQADAMIRRLLENQKHIMVDASGVGSFNKLLKKVFQKKESPEKIWHRLEDMLLNDEVIFILKYMSRSKIPHSGDYVRDMFKILDDAWERKWNGKKMIQTYTYPQSSIMLLDYPSYLEKNMQSFWYYSVPVYATSPKGRRLARK